jgi:hypothetical protein
MSNVIAMLMTERIAPDRGAISGLLSGVTFVGAIVGAMKLARGPIPRPGSDPEAVRAYYGDSAVAARFSASGQLVSILMLARFTASVARLAGRSDRRGALRPAAWSTGALSAASLAATAFTHASLTAPQPRSDGDVTRLARRVFVVGGPIHGVVYGVFTSVAAAAGRDAGLLGAPAARAGYAAAAAGVLSPAYFRWENAGWLIPIGRFGGDVVTGILATRLARGTR